MLKLILKPTPILIFCWMISGALFAQDKIERELRVEEKEVPKEARDWLYDAFETTKRPKWYQEIFESGYSYEAKFKLIGKFYSVEFDSLGLIQDVEIEVDFKELPKEVQAGLEDYLLDEYKSSDIKRIQIQYSGKADDLEDFFDENSLEGILTRFEIEFVGPDETGASQLFEGLFSEKGTLIFKRKIALVPSENLLY
ncbi:hypothetical protein PBT90_05905 [Algoriphagus halophytocola]|uniref:Uncharacterized protein n=1 Tax=Algoriphagus halophytocola TaxID=2991499 RepID=A0ABY6MJU9_9BACT|nr:MULTISPECIES: hypothetical protein [unclassified Algoriphagus]UZD22951.1 hypothetical protein OM944_00350 [Algoriphagus sp. TR-M5]WBL44220.1 hypothetical protein PBT90_05905 [Algoriphagus sp. TR-M9]